MKKTGILLFAVFAFAFTARAGGAESLRERPVEITLLDGDVTLEMSGGVEFPCIGIQLSDKNVRAGMGTCLEVKRDGNSYLVKVKYDPRKFSTIDKGIEAYLKELFARFYEEKDKGYGKRVWKAFVKEGGLQTFIDVAKEYIDDDFLDSPFNEIYG